MADHLCPKMCPSKKICHCLNVQKVPRDSIVEIILEDGKKDIPKISGPIFPETSSDPESETTE